MNGSTPPRARKAYQFSEPWQLFEQLLPFHPALLATSFVPLMCVALLTAEELYPAPWQLLQAMFLLACLLCFPLVGGVAWQLEQFRAVVEVHDIGLAVPLAFLPLVNLPWQ